MTRWEWFLHNVWGVIEFFAMLIGSALVMWFVVTLLRHV